MNSNNVEVDQYLRTIGQVEPEPENPGGGGQVTDNEDPA